MGLERELAVFRADFSRAAPQGRAALWEAKTGELRACFAKNRAPDVRDKAPGFAFPGEEGGRVILDDAPQQEPVVPTSYRGHWCPECNQQLRADHAVASKVAAPGAKLVAISSQRPDKPLGTVEQNALTVDRLSDVGNVVARSLGLVQGLLAERRETLRSNDKAQSRINGDENWELPVPATSVIGKGGRALLATLHVDDRTRLKPGAIVAAFRKARS
jgi:peroxiredoxin